MIFYVRKEENMNIKKELNHKLYLQRESNISLPDYDNEQKFYHAIVSGNVDEINKLNKIYFPQRRTYGRQNGKLADDLCTNRKYYFIILASTIMRFCLDAGMDRETAFSLCSIYISKADKMTSINKIDVLENDMILEFTKHMNERKKQNIFSIHISKCMDYIYDNLHYKITVNAIAEYLNMSPSYLSKLFSKEVNMSISTYIKEQRLIAAANMLIYTDNSISEISEYFVFSSQSHFTTAFQNKYGITPKKYRDQHITQRTPVLS